jgi:phosphopantothenoylcysteine synthetase/decarboxylase
VVANNVLTGMDSDENEVTMLFRDGQRKQIGRAPKKMIARELVKFFLIRAKNV